MKLSKAKLKQIIGEELDAITANQKLAYEGSDCGPQDDIEVGEEETPEEKERRLQAADLKAAEEILATRAGDYSSYNLPEGKTNNKMKLTKERLKAIIKEELALNEAFPGAELVTQFISFIQSNPEVAIAAISANAAGLAIAEMLESIAFKVRDAKAQQEKP